MSAERPGRPRRRRCPICGRPPSARFRPFCSRRCRDRDFLHWLEGRYRLPSAGSGEEVEEVLPENEDR